MTNLTAEFDQITALADDVLVDLLRTHPSAVQQACSALCRGDLTTARALIGSDRVAAFAGMGMTAAMLRIADAVEREK